MVADSIGLRLLRPLMYSQVRSAFTYVSLVKATHLNARLRHFPSASARHLQKMAVPPLSATQTRVLGPVSVSSTRAVAAGRPRCYVGRVRRVSSRHGRVGAYLVLVRGWFSFTASIARIWGGLRLFGDYSKVHQLVNVWNEDKVVIV